MAHRKEPNCCCTKLDGPSCEHDSRVPPMPLLLVGGRPAKQSSGTGDIGSDAELIDEDNQRERMEPLIAFQRKMARCVTVCGGSGYKNFMHDDMPVNRAARMCPCRLIEEPPAETAEEKLTKRLAVILFLARQWHEKEAIRHEQMSAVQTGSAAIAYRSSNGNDRDFLTKKD